MAKNVDGIVVRKTPVQKKAKKSLSVQHKKKKSHKKEIILLVILIFLIGILASTVFFRESILSFLSA